MKNQALARIQSMKPYAPPLEGRRAYGGNLLDFNERTTTASIKIKMAILDFLSRDTLQVYPEYGNLEQKLAGYVNVSPEQILITNGSDQGIDLVFRTFTDASDRVIIPTPSFSMFFQAAQSVGNTIFSPEYEPSTLAFPLQKVLENINSTVKLIVICNPNNPTGTLLQTRDIESIARKGKNAIVFVDEAYFEFSQTSVIPSIRKYPNIVVTRTFSKAFGLASLRVGYIVARKEYIEEFKKIRGPYDINMLAQVAASTALDDIGEMKNYATEIMTRAKPMVEKFFKINKIPFYPSASNFILFKPDNPSEVAETLKDRGILVRPQNKPGIQNTLRVTIGQMSQMKQFINVYTQYILEKQNSKKNKPHWAKAQRIPKEAQFDSPPLRSGLSSISEFENSEYTRQRNKYAFLDRDGTLIFEPTDTYQVDTIKQLRILEGVIKGLKLLIQQGYTLMMVTNQDGLGTATYPLWAFKRVQKKLLAILKKNGITFTQIYICPHLSTVTCVCRKPKVGLVEKLIMNNSMNTTDSFVCGDRKTDGQFAKNIGIRFIRMKTNGNFYTALKERL